MPVYNSVVALIPEELKDDANRLWRWLGRDESPDPGASFSVPIASKAKYKQITWYGFHDWSVNIDDLKAWLEMKSAGDLPQHIGKYWTAPPLEEYLLSGKSAKRVISALHLAVNHGWMKPVDFFEAVLEVNGLTRFRGYSD